MLNEREFELINIVGADLAVNQRDLSRQMNLSLGMTNMLIRRLVTKGYIRIQQLNKRKVSYLLTPKGFAEKMRKSVRYTMKTIHSIGLIRQSITRMMADMYQEGHRKFYVLGASDLALLIGMTVQEAGMSGCQFIRVEMASQASSDGMLLICKETTEDIDKYGFKRFNVVENLARDEALAGYMTPAVAGQ